VGPYFYVPAPPNFDAKYLELFRKSLSVRVAQQHRSPPNNPPDLTFLSFFLPFSFLFSQDKVSQEAKDSNVKHIVAVEIVKKARQVPPHRFCCCLLFLNPRPHQIKASSAFMGATWPTSSKSPPDFPAMCQSPRVRALYITFW